MIAPIQFNYFAVSLEKSTFQPGDLTKQIIRERTIEALVNPLLDWYQPAEACEEWPAGLNERVIYDECSDFNYKKLLKSRFSVTDPTRTRPGKLVRSIKAGRSRSDPRLQLVDMVCGAIGRHLSGDQSYHKLLSDKELGISMITGNQ